MGEQRRQAEILKSLETISNRDIMVGDVSNDAFSDLVKHVLDIPSRTILTRVIRGLRESEALVRRGESREAYEQFVSLVNDYPLDVISAALALLPRSLSQRLWDVEVKVYSIIIYGVISANTPLTDRTLFTLMAVQTIADNIQYDTEENIIAELEELQAPYTTPEGTLSVAYVTGDMGIENVIKDEAEAVATIDTVLPMSKILHKQPPFMEGILYPLL